MLEGLADYVGPILVAAGDRDAYAPVEVIKGLVEKINRSGAGSSRGQDMLPDGMARLVIVPGADHFFSGLEDLVAGTVGAFLDQLDRG